MVPEQLSKLIGTTHAIYELRKWTRVDPYPIEIDYFWEFFIPEDTDSNWYDVQNECSAIVTEITPSYFDWDHESEQVGWNICFDNGAKIRIFNEEIENLEK